MSEWTEAGTEGRLTVWGRVEPEGPRWPTGGQVPWRMANRETDTAPLLDSRVQEWKRQGPATGFQVPGGGGRSAQVTDRVEVKMMSGESWGRAGKGS